MLQRLDSRTWTVLLVFIGCGLMMTTEAFEESTSLPSKLEPVTAVSYTWASEADTVFIHEDLGDNGTVNSLATLKVEWDELETSIHVSYNLTKCQIVDSAESAVVVSMSLWTDRSALDLMSHEIKWSVRMVAVRNGTWAVDTEDTEIRADDKVDLLADLQFNKSSAETVSNNQNGLYSFNLTYGRTVHLASGTRDLGDGLWHFRMTILASDGLTKWCASTDPSDQVCRVKGSSGPPKWLTFLAFFGLMAVSYAALIFVMYHSFMPDFFNLVPVEPFVVIYNNLHDGVAVVPAPQ